MGIDFSEFPGCARVAGGWLVTPEVYAVFDRHLSNLRAAKTEKLRKSVLADLAGESRIAGYVVGVEVFRDPLKRSRVRLAYGHEHFWGELRLGVSVKLHDKVYEKDMFSYERRSWPWNYYGVDMASGPDESRTWEVTSEWVTTDEARKRWPWKYQRIGVSKKPGELVTCDEIEPAGFSWRNIGRTVVNEICAAWKAALDPASGTRIITTSDDESEPQRERKTMRTKDRLETLEVSLEEARKDRIATDERVAEVRGDVALLRHAVGEDVCQAARYGASPGMGTRIAIVESRIENLAVRLVPTESNGARLATLAARVTELELFKGFHTEAIDTLRRNYKDAEAVNARLSTVEKTLLSLVERMDSADFEGECGRRGGHRYTCVECDYTHGHRFQCLLCEAQYMTNPGEQLTPTEQALVDAVESQGRRKAKK